MNIGRAIKEIRKRKGLSQLDLSEATDISQTSLSQIESGNKRPNPSSLKKICKAHREDSYEIENLENRVHMRKLLSFEDFRKTPGVMTWRPKCTSHE